MAAMAEAEGNTAQSQLNYKAISKGISINNINTRTMKMILTFSSLLALLGLCSRNSFGIIESGKNEKPEGKAVSYQYSYSGTMAYPINYFEVSTLEDGTIQLGYSHDDNDIHLVRVHEDALKKIEEMAAEYKLHKLAESYRPRAEVLDGYGWHVYIGYENGSISSGGSNAWPSAKLYSGIGAINNYLDSLKNAATPSDSLGLKHHQDY